MEKDKQITHIAIVLDRSGSMWKTKDSTVRGYNEQVQQIKEDSQDENHDIFASLVTFNGNVTEHLWNVPADKLEEANEADFIPTGGTAMRDAIGHTVKKLLETTDSNNENVSYLICVISDGEENSSKHFDKDHLRELLESVQNTGRWTINYMGCDEQYLRKVAKETAVPVSNCAIWANDTSANTEFAFKETKGKLNKFLKSRASGQSASSTYCCDVPDSMECYVPEELAQPVSKQKVSVTLDNSILNNISQNCVQTMPTKRNMVKKNSNNVFGKGETIKEEVWSKYKR